MKRKVLIPLGILLGLAVIGLVAFPLISANTRGKQSQNLYQTEPVKKGSLSVAVGATGTVRANQSAAIIWQTSGKIASVNVLEGQKVESDVVLAELDASSVSQSILQAQIDLLNAKDALDNAINNSEERADTHLALIQAQQAVDDAEEEAQSKLYRRASQETIDIARANLINANEALDQAEQIWEQTRGADQDGLVYAAGLSQYARARQEQQASEYNLRYVEELPDPLAVEEARVKLDQAKAKLLTAKQNWEKVKDGPSADEVQVAQVKLDIAQATLDLTRLTAPFAGTITKVSSQTGDLVTTGTPAFQIDDISSLLIDADVSEVDINQIQVGQKVDLTFDAIAGQEYSGSVTKVASSGSSSNGTVYFTITVEILNPSAEIKPGMTAAVNIIVNQLDDVLLVPSRTVRTINGQRIVYVLNNNLPIPQKVTLGASANSYSQIIEGDLKEGDLVILNPPTNTLQMGPGGGAPGGMSAGGQE